MATVVEEFNFNNKKLPKNKHVLEYVFSRTSHFTKKISNSKAISDMAEEVHGIWTSANCPPKSTISIEKMFGKLVLEKKRIKKE